LDRVRMIRTGSSADWLKTWQQPAIRLKTAFLVNMRTMSVLQAIQDRGLSERRPLVRWAWADEMRQYGGESEQTDW
jgi:hypothetical protein